MIRVVHQKIGREQSERLFKRPVGQWPIEMRIARAMGQFKREMGYAFDLNHPVLFTEKRVWYMLFPMNTGINSCNRVYCGVTPRILAEKLPVTARGYEDRDIPRPAHLERMVEIAEELSRGFPHIRMDFYDTADGLYIGEMTLYSTTVYEQRDWDLRLGNLFVLPIIN